MIVQQEDREVARCRQLIEEKVGWGSAGNWSTQDFERLSGLIAEHTGVSLSVTTLKRIWGRVKYDSAPTATTLNALVQFIGYDHWPQFKTTSQPELVTKMTTIDVVLPKLVEFNWRPTGRRYWLGAASLIGLIGVSLFLLNYVKRKPLSPDRFSFSSQPVTTGIPNSVVFHYDATASPTDSVFIQQSWDPRRREPVSKDGHAYTSIYYHPGHFQAKLVVGDQIVREHSLMIPSAGWHVVAMQEPVPVYFSESDAIRMNSLTLPVETIQQHTIPMQPKSPVVRYRYVRELERLKSDNFKLETRVRNDFRQGSSICQNITISILCKNDYFAIPLSAKGCVGDLEIYLAGHFAQARNTNLSGFGADLSQWTDLRCDVRNGRAQVFVGDKKAYDVRIPAAAKDIVGVSYDFAGTGSVDFVRFTRPDGTIAFEDNFNVPKTGTTKALK